MKKIKLISKDKVDKIEVLKVLKDFYLNEGYVEISKSGFLNSIIPKFIKYFNFLKRIKISLEAPPKKNYIIYDTNNIDTLKIILPSDEIFLLPVRIKEIKKIYLDLGLLFSISVNFFRQSLKQSYINYIIKKVSPKIILTAVEVSADFYRTAKNINNKKIKFIAIQHSCLRACDYVHNFSVNKEIFIPQFYCFSNYEKNTLGKTKANISHYLPVGSLKAATFLKKIKEKNLIFNQNKFDICLISEPAPRATNDVHGYEDYQEIPGLVAESTYRLCKKRNLKLLFISKFYSYETYFREEQEYYKYFLKNHDFKIIPKDNFLSTFEYAFQSNLTIGHSSTALREIFSLKKKVLQWNYSKNEYLSEPFSGPSYLEGSDYNKFEEKILYVLQLSFEDYIKKLDKNLSICEDSSRTINKIEEEILKNLNQK